MGKAMPDVTLDQILNFIATGTELVVCSTTTPTTFLQASSSYALADVVIDAGDFAIAAATSAVTSEAPALKVNAALAVAAATSAVTSDSPEIVYNVEANNTSLTVQDATCAVTSENAAVVFNSHLTIQDATCATASNNLLATGSAFHGLLALTNSVMSEETPILTVHADMVVADATCAVTSDSPEIVYNEEASNTSLVVANATCAVTAEAPKLTISTELLETLVDTFDDNSIDPAKWTSSAELYTIAEINQRIEVTTTPGDGVAYLSSLNLYDLRESSCSVKLIAPSPETIYHRVLLTDYDTNCGVNFVIEESYYKAYYSNTSGPYFYILVGSCEYDPDVHKYLRIREASGTVYWDYSTNSFDWTNLYSVATATTGAVFDKVRVRLEVAAASMVNTVIYEDFNVTHNSLTVAAATCAVTSDTMALLIHAYLAAIANSTCLTYSDGPMAIESYTTWKHMTRTQLATFRWRPGLF